MRNVIFLLIALNCAYFIWQMALNMSDMQAARALPPPPEDIRQLVTLQEQKSDAEQSSTETRQIEDVTERQPPGAVVPLSCQALGPFLAESEVKAFAKRLGKLGLSVKPHTRYLREQVGYSVVLAAMEYRDALEIKRKLEQNNIKANIIGSDNVLSLGAFRDKSEAEKERARAVAIGLDPHVEPSYARRSTYWLVLQGNDARKQDLAGMTGKHPELRVEIMPCP
jgi:hypothetical protein